MHKTAISVTHLRVLARAAAVRHSPGKMLKSWWMMMISIWTRLYSHASFRRSLPSGVPGGAFSKTSSAKDKCHQMSLKWTICNASISQCYYLPKSYNQLSTIRKEWSVTINDGYSFTMLSIKLTAVCVCALERIIYGLTSSRRSAL